jgi:hypothetical protein
MTVPTVPSSEENLPLIKYHQEYADSGVILCPALPQDQNVNRVPSFLEHHLHLAFHIQPYKTELFNTAPSQACLEHQLHMSLQHATTVPLVVLQDKAQPCGCLYQSPSNVRVVTV